MACKNASLHKCLSSVDVYEQKVTSVTSSLRVPATPPIFWPGFYPVLSTLFFQPSYFLKNFGRILRKETYFVQLTGILRSSQTPQIIHGGDYEKKCFQMASNLISKLETLRLRI